jgi:hypothetical protein
VNSKRSRYPTRPPFQRVQSAVIGLVRSDVVCVLCGPPALFAFKLFDHKVGKARISCGDVTCIIGIQMVTAVATGQRVRSIPGQGLDGFAPPIARGISGFARNSVNFVRNVWCREGELNPQGTKYRRILSPTRSFSRSTIFKTFQPVTSK